MTPKVRVVMNTAGVRALLRSPGIAADLKARADRIAAATGPTMEPGVDMIASVEVGPSRARASVVTATPHAMNGEAKDRRLTRAVDAGR